MKTRFHEVWFSTGSEIRGSFSREGIKRKDRGVTDAAALGLTVAIGLLRCEPVAEGNANEDPGQGVAHLQ